MPDLEARSLRMMGIALLDDMAGPVVWRRLVFVISYWGQVWGDLNIVSRVRSECNERSRVFGLYKGHQVCQWKLASSYYYSGYYSRVVSMISSVFHADFLM